MCGRFSFAGSKEKVKKQFGFNIKTNIKKSYNIAPTQKAYVVTNENPKLLQQMEWGLIPNWAKKSQIGSNLINARMEGISTKPSFRMPIRKRRCLVLADSFYEWKKIGKNKHPYRILLGNRNLMAMAGIWDVWISPANLPVYTFTIITTKPNKEMSSIHNRMPVILTNKEEQKAWLDSPDLELVLNMLNPLPDDSLMSYQVSQKVNTPRYNSIDLHNVVKESPTLF